MAYPTAFLDDLRARVLVSEVVGRRVELKRKGTEFVGLSPFQAERSPSFTVNDHKQLWKDFSSGKGGDIFHFLMEAEGLDFPAAVAECAKLAGVNLPNGNGADKKTAKHSPPEEPPFDPDAYAQSGSPKAQPKTRSKAKITATYDYTDVHGNLLYQVCRKEWKEDGKPKKTFLQRRPAPDGKAWIWGLGAGEFIQSKEGDWYQATQERIDKWGGAERRTFTDEIKHGLYNLMELREAGLDELVFLPEGEKDVDTLRRLGLVASTNSGGAKNWRPELAETFRGRDVIILLDNDQPGRDRGTVIADTLRGRAERVRVVDFLSVWPDAPKGADVTDWIKDREGTVEELIEIIQSVKDWEPPPFISKFDGFPFEHLDDPGLEHEHLIDGILTVGDKSIIGGASGSGKSFLAIEMAMCIATGTNFFGHKIMQRGLVVYQAGEGGRGIKKRFRAWRQFHNIEPRARIPVFILPAKIDIHSPEGDTSKLIEELTLIQRMYGMPILATFIDTLAKASGAADENSGKDMSVVMGNIDKISAAFPQMHTCLVHHLNAGKTKLRGHTSVHAGVDQVIIVSRDEDNPKIRTAVLDKQKDEEDGATINFELWGVTVGYRAVDGEAITSCVTIPTGAEVKANAGPHADRSKKLSDTTMLAFDALKDAIAEYGIPTPAGFGIPRIVRTVVDVKRWKDFYRARASDPLDNTVTQTLKRANERLLRLKLIGRINPYVWLTPRGDFTAAHSIYEPAADGTVPPDDQGEFDNIVDFPGPNEPA